VDTTFFIPGNDTDNSGFPNFQGTSAATPHVAGAAALQIAANPGTPPISILQLLEQTALDIQAPGFDFSTGFGLVQVVPAQPPPPPPPTSSLPDDQFEPNDTSDQATNFGTLNGSQQFTNLTVNVHPSTGLPDYDWYRWTAGSSGTFTATISIRPEQGDLELHIFTLDSNNTLVELARSVDKGASNRTLSVAVQAGQTLFVEVKGRNSALNIFGTGTYDITAGIA
jgi:hypothetical protein